MATAGMVLVLASAAFACTTYKGMMTVTAGTTASVVVGDNTNGSHRYCSPILGPGAQASSGSTVAIKVGPAADCLGGSASPTVGQNKLAGTFNVKFYNGAGFTGGATSYAWNTHCGPNGPGVLLSDPGTGLTAVMAVDVTGAGQVAVTLPTGLTANSMGDASAICVNDTTATAGNPKDGNQAPIVII